MTGEAVDPDVGAAAGAGVCDGEGLGDFDPDDPEDEPPPFWYLVAMQTQSSL